MRPCLTHYHLLCRHPWGHSTELWGWCGSSWVPLPPTSWSKGLSLCGHARNLFQEKQWLTCYVHGLLDFNKMHCKTFPTPSNNGFSSAPPPPLSGSVSLQWACPTNQNSPQSWLGALYSTPESMQCPGVYMFSLMLCLLYILLALLGCPSSFQIILGCVSHSSLANLKWKSHGPQRV